MSPQILGWNLLLRCGLMTKAEGMSKCFLGILEHNSPPQGGWERSLDVRNSSGLFPTVMEVLALVTVLQLAGICGVQGFTFYQWQPTSFFTSKLSLKQFPLPGIASQSFFLFSKAQPHTLSSMKASLNALNSSLYIDCKS